ncbi:MAG: hypothetical protein II370_03805, partial [Clostridia bacterium]|nr:hypothetical protein [Clostridia bacterium]
MRSITVVFIILLVLTCVFACSVKAPPASITEAPVTTAHSIEATETTVPITEPVTEPVTDPVTEPVIEPVTDFVTEPITEPVTEPITEPVTEPVT